MCFRTATVRERQYHGVLASENIKLSRYIMLTVLSLKYQEERMERETTSIPGALNRRRFLGRGAAAGFLLSSSLRNLQAAKSEPSGSIATTVAGKVRGGMHEKVHAFKGVPYGASTAGAGRFMPPMKPQPWTGVRDALEWGRLRRRFPHSSSLSLWRSSPPVTPMAAKTACT